MAEPFKTLINIHTVQRAAQRVAALWPAFDAQRFTQLASHGLDALQMKARALQLCSALEAK